MNYIIHTVSVMRPELNNMIVHSTLHVALQQKTKHVHVRTYIYVCICVHRNM